ncbi:notch-regulated ankyrin repeat-containing protein B-like [Anneissia japonica]|uniref:notch-regulated ankyrin repeat-containing protein B-like n=1 Tax=Anneissia japonica TaxID=1529436 RepID=UPI00142584D5|nr:notch-regulated ankyrin repeat-containing protein B-like [Anneissia japonica]
MSTAQFESSPSQHIFEEAVRNGDTMTVVKLLQSSMNGHVNVNTFDAEGQTALHQSVINGNFEAVKLLVQFGADVRLANKDGWNAVHIAAWGGHQDIALFLLTNGKMQKVKTKHHKKDDT